MMTKTTDMITITAAKANVTPTISAIRPFSVAWSFSLTNSVTFFSSAVGLGSVGLNSFFSGLTPEN